MKDQTDKLYVIRAETRVLRRTVNQGRKKAMNRIRKKNHVSDSYVASIRDSYAE